MIRRFDACDPADLARGLTAAAKGARRGELIVLPTESAYGVATDAFSSAGLARIRSIKNRGAELPVPVLIGAASTADGLMSTLSDDARALVDSFWPGMLTLVGDAQPSLTWDVGPAGDTTVSVRMPLHPVPWRLAKLVGPLALTGANVAGADLPLTCDEAIAQFGSGVSVYLDAGPCTMTQASSVVDITNSPPRLLRVGAISLEQLQAVVPAIAGIVESQ